MSRRDYRAQLPSIVAELRARAERHAPEAAVCASDGLTVTNAAGDEAVMRIYDEISFFGITASDVADELDKITASSLRVEINSPGGSVFDGIAIYNALRAHPATVTTRVDGLAGSIASVIAQAGDVRVMQPSAQMMIHRASGLTVGNADDHQDMAAVLEQQDEVIAGIYAERSGRDVEEFRQLMADDTWLTDRATVDLGLADVVAKNAPKNVATRPANTVTAPSPAPDPTPAASGVPFSVIAKQAQRRRRAAC